MDFLLFFHECVVLGDTAESKFVHEVDFIRIVHVFVLADSQYGSDVSIFSRRTLKVFTTSGKVAEKSMT